MYAFLSALRAAKPGDRLDRWNWWTQFNSGRVYPLELDFQRLAYTAVLK